jgi:GH35 family endo-1,4-beta-xylanase
MMIKDMLEFARMLKDNGAKVDILGVQGHVGQTPRAPASVISDLDLLAADGHEIQITEFDHNTKDEQLQGDYARDFLISIYSHPKVTGFIMWGFWQSMHWKPDAAMFRADWSPKPNFRAWQDLVVNRWKTKFSSVTPATGTVAGRGHFGRYKAVATFGNRTGEVEFDFTKEARPVVLRLNGTAAAK